MAKSLFSKEQIQQITDAIKEAELNTSGEVRVHIEQKCKGDALDRATNVFETLKMHKTEQRNGVLFYLAVKDHKFAILGDAGINQKTGDQFWSEIKDLMQDKFRTGLFTDGLTEGIKMAGLKLKAHFPYQSNDKNELSDEISFGQ
jgi:uncharacterized membrane protein